MVINVLALVYKCCTCLVCISIKPSLPLIALLQLFPQGTEKENAMSEMVAKKGLRR